MAFNREITLGLFTVGIDWSSAIWLHRDILGNRHCKPGARHRLGGLAQTRNRCLNKDDSLSAALAFLSRKYQARPDFTGLVCPINHHLVYPNRLFSNERLGQGHQFGKRNPFKPKAN